MGCILYKNHLKMGKNADVKIPLLIPTQRLDAGLLKSVSNIKAHTSVKSCLKLELRNCWECK